LQLLVVDWDCPVQDSVQYCGRHATAPMNVVVLELLCIKFSSNYGLVSERLPAAAIKPRHLAGFRACSVSTVPHGNGCCNVHAPAYPGFAIDEANVQRPSARPTYESVRSTTRSGRVGQRARMGESAGPKTSLWRGSRPTPNPTNMSAKEVMVSSAYL